MNVVGIITEYNPMHNGHIYNIQKAKELAHADYVVVIMSGSFTQQGNISVINKMDKAKIAIQNGADMVIELPTIFATSSAENFAFGAVNILNSLGVVTHLAFGAECENICDLQEIASLYVEHKEEIISKSKELLRQGISSADAYIKALGSFTNKPCCIYSKPNNILAIEYLKALIALKSKIKPILVYRLNSCHSDDKITNTSDFASSTSIRNILNDQALSLEQKLNNIKNVVPTNTYEYLKNISFNTNENLWNILKYEIIKLNKSGLKDIYEVTEGLENKIYDNALTCDSYHHFIFSVKSKRYTLSKIKRICIYILLGITKEYYLNLKNVNYARILKTKKTSLPLLSAISKNANNLVITKITDDIIQNMNKAEKESVKLDILANNLFNSPNADYTNKIIQP